MFKKLLTSLLLIALILIGGVWMLKVPLVNHYLGNNLNYEAKISTMSVGFSSSSIGDFYLKNVGGAKVDDALTIEEAKASYTMEELRAETTTIDQVHIDGIVVALEFYNDSGSDNNWKKILSDITDPVEEDQKQKPFLIRKTVVENLTLLLVRKGSDTIEEKKFDRLEFENIGTNQPIPMDAFIGIFIENLIRELFVLPQLKGLVNGVLEEPKKFLDKFNPFKGDN